VSCELLDNEEHEMKKMVSEISLLKKNKEK